MDHCIENFAAVWILVDIEKLSAVGLLKSVKTVKHNGEEVLPRFSTDELAQSFIKESKLAGIRPLKIDKQQFLAVLRDFQRHVRGENVCNFDDPIKGSLSGRLQSIEGLIAMVENSNGT